MRALLAVACLLLISTGCAKRLLPCTAPLEAGLHECELQRPEGTRRFLLHVPAALAQPAPLVVSFHGRKGDGAQQSAMSRFGTLADAHGFLVAFPDGFEKSWNAGNCCGTAHERGVDDVAFTRAMVERVRALAAVDERRIYATGFSNGARMTYAVACLAADLFAAVAPVGGPPGVEPCAPVRPVPLLHLHGTADECNPYLGGDGPDTADNASIPETVAAWAKRNGCTQSRTTLEVGRTTCTEQTSCAQGADVVACITEGAGHIWPGAEPYTLWRVCGGEWIDDVDATALIWDFFQRHPKP